MNSSNPTPFDNLIQGLLGTPPTFDTFLAVMKLFILFALTLYIVFGFVIIRQISLMNRTIKTNISGLLRIAGWVHLGLTFLVWFIAYTVL